MNGGRADRGDQQRANENPLEDATWLYSYADLVTQLLLFAILMVTVIGIEAAPSPTATEAAPSPTVTEAAPPQKQEGLRQAVEELDRYVKASALEGSVSIEQGFDRIVIRVKSKLLFQEGEAALTPQAEQVLSGIVPVVGRMTTPIRVEGHTDDRPIRTGRFPSNWELSSARAISVAIYLEGRGVPRARLSVAGYGEYHPIIHNDGEEHRALNRRVEIVLLGQRP